MGGAATAARRSGQRSMLSILRSSQVRMVGGIPVILFLHITSPDIDLTLTWLYWLILHICSNPFARHSYLHLCEFPCVISIKQGSNVKNLCYVIQFLSTNQHQSCGKEYCHCQHYHNNPMETVKAPLLLGHITSCACLSLQCHFRVDDSACAIQVPN